MLTAWYRILDIGCGFLCMSLTEITSIIIDMGLVDTVKSLSRSQLYDSKLNVHRVLRFGAIKVLLLLKKLYKGSVKNSYRGITYARY